MTGNNFGYDLKTEKSAITFREHVPSWWGLRSLPWLFFDPKVLILTAFYVALGYVMGLLFGGVGAWILFCAIVGFSLGLIASYRQGVSIATTALTGTPSLRGIVADFAVELTVTHDGSVELYREWLAVDPQYGGSYKRAVFTAGALVSIERRSFASVEPDSFARYSAAYQTGGAQRIAARRYEEARNAEVIMLVFNDGQELVAAWQNDRNIAAALQTNLVSFFKAVRQQCASDRRRADSLSTLSPDDSPL